MANRPYNARCSDQIIQISTWNALTSLKYY